MRCVCVCSDAQSCPTLCDFMDYSPPGSSVHGIFQARLWEWVATFYFRKSFQPWDLIGRWFLYHWATWKASSIHFSICKFSLSPSPPRERHVTLREGYSSCLSAIYSLLTRVLTPYLFLWAPSFLMQNEEIGLWAFRTVVHLDVEGFSNSHILCGLLFELLHFIRPSVWKLLEPSHTLYRLK